MFWLLSVSQTKEIEDILSFPTHSSVKSSAVQTNPVTRYHSQIQEVLNEIKSDLHVLVSQSRPSGMVQHGDEIYFNGNSEDEIDELYHNSSEE